MKYILIIKVDTNDADYVENSQEVSLDQLEELRPVFKAIKNSKKRHNWNVSEYRHSDEESPQEMYVNVLTEDQIDLMNEMTPATENGFHSIISIKLLTVLEEETLFERGA